MPWRRYGRLNPRRYIVRFEVLRGRKGLGFLMLGLLWLLLGRGVQLNIPVETPGAFHFAIPSVFRASLWYATGLFAIASVWKKEWRSWAVFGLMWMPGTRLCSYLGAWILSELPHRLPLWTHWLLPESAERYLTAFLSSAPVGDPNGWYRATFYVVLIGLVFYVAGVPDSMSPKELRALSDVQ